MATSNTSLKALLENLKFPIFENGDGVLLYPFAHQGQLFHIRITLQEEGEYLQFTIPYFLNLSDAIDRETALLKLLELNWTKKLLKYGLDPGDNEVVAAIEIGVEDSSFTEAQLLRCLHYLGVFAMAERDRLQTLFRTGIYPGSEDPGFTDSLERLLAE